MPAAVDLNILYDRSQSIRASVNDVQLTFLVTLVISGSGYLFILRKCVSYCNSQSCFAHFYFGTLALIRLLNFSLNNLTLMALTLSVGFVVDDAIVMLENIVRHREKGESPLDAALNGASEIGFTIVSMTTSLVAVFIPVLFLPGLIGRIFNEFAVTISIAIIISGIVSLTLTPMLCSRFLHMSSEKVKNNGHRKYLQKMETEMVMKKVLLEQLHRISEKIFHKGLEFMPGL